MEVTQSMIEELQGLVLSVLQQSLQVAPEGYSVSEFIKIFPERADEPPDWYKRYKKRDALQALELINGTVVHVGYNERKRTMWIQLNMKSDKIDRHLVDLIKGQRAPPSKKKRGGSYFSRPSSRAQSSFSLNRVYTKSSNNSYKARLNQDQHYGNESFVNRGSSHAAPPQLKTSQYRTGSIDPRLKNSNGSSSHITPAQVRSTSSSWQQTSSSKLAQSVAHSSPAQKSQPPSTSRSQVLKPKASVPSPAPTSRPTPTPTSAPTTIKLKEDDSVLRQKKSYLGQRILSMLTRKFADIKLLHLAALYELEFQETIDPTAYGYTNITNLMQDPEINNYIEINWKPPFISVSAKRKSLNNGKENNVNGENTKHPADARMGSADGHLADKSNTISSAKAKVDAIDPFNVRTMLQNLEPIGTVKEPILKALEIEENIKFKTFRIIFKSPNSTLRLEDWPLRFEQESRLKPRLQDYGCKTLLEFFKLLAKDLPINVILKGDEWIAKADIDRLSGWIKVRMAEGHYRSIIAIEARYELIALPNENYTYTNAKSLLSKEVVYHPAYILSIHKLTDKTRYLYSKPIPNSMWIQLRTTERIEKHLCIEDAMTAYEDYTKKSPLKLPTNFIKAGLPCAVYDNTQQRWCRALILNAPEIIDRNYDVTALLVDYAIVRNYPVSQLQCLMKTHLKPIVGPIFSRLSGIKNEHDINVQRQSKRILQEYTSPPVTLACQFQKAIQSGEHTYLPSECIEITLIDTRHGRDCNLAESVNLPVESTNGSIQ